MKSNAKVAQSKNVNNSRTKQIGQVGYGTHGPKVRGTRFGLLSYTDEEMDGGMEEPNSSQPMLITQDGINPDKTVATVMQKAQSNKKCPNHH